MEALQAWCWLIGLYLAMACGYCLNAYLFLMENPVIQEYFKDAFQAEFKDDVYSFVTVGAVYFVSFKTSEGSQKFIEYDFSWKMRMGASLCMFVHGLDFWSVWPWSHQHLFWLFIAEGRSIMQSSNRLEVKKHERLKWESFGHLSFRFHLKRKKNQLSLRTKDP